MNVTNDFKKKSVIYYPLLAHTQTVVDKSRKRSSKMSAMFCASRKSRIQDVISPLLK